MNVAPRYAIYLAPDADSALWQFGSAFLGYDAQTGEDVTPIILPGFDVAQMQTMSAHPRHYGFHMTLKAPFRLATTQTEPKLIAALTVFAQTMTRFEMGQLGVECRCERDGAGFVCLAPAQNSAELMALEQRIVPSFDHFRAPLTDQEIARRQPERLEAQERDYLMRYGYPFVLEAFRPHFSLTGTIEKPEKVADALAMAQGAGLSRFTCSGLALFKQENPNSRFRIIQRFAAGLR
jgi:Protein of unknown function (DUF1045)